MDHAREPFFRCVFEGGVSILLLVRLSVFPNMRAVMQKLPPKLLSLASGRDAEIVHLELDSAKLHEQMENVVASIQRATFTGQGDVDEVRAR